MLLLLTSICSDMQEWHAAELEHAETLVDVSLTQSRSARQMQQADAFCCSLLAAPLAGLLVAC